MTNCLTKVEIGISIKLLLPAHPKFKKTNFYFRNAFDQLPGQVNGWTSKNNLNLVAGSHYSIRVTTVNGARLSSVHDTTGVTIDPTAPDVSSLFSFTSKGTSLFEQELGYLSITIMNDTNI